MEANSCCTMAFSVLKELFQRKVDVMGMFAVTKDGIKLPIDDSAIKDDDSWKHPVYDFIAVYNDWTTLRDVWVVELNRHNFNTKELEFLKEVKFYHKPSKEEILHAMAAHGCNYYDDVAFVKKGYELAHVDS